MKSLQVSAMKICMCLNQNELYRQPIKSAMGTLICSKFSSASIYDNTVKEVFARIYALPVLLPLGIQHQPSSALLPVKDDLMLLRRAYLY